MLFQCYFSKVLQLFVTDVVGISTVRKALDSRPVNIPSTSTDCVVEAVEICLRVKNCQFSGNGTEKTLRLCRLADEYH